MVRARDRKGEGIGRVGDRDGRVEGKGGWG